jgi:hypothetical protein
LWAPSYDPLYVIRFFDVLLAEYPRDEIEVCGITIDRAFHEPLWKTLRRIHGFYGPWGLVRQGLRLIDARLRRRSIEALAALTAPAEETGRRCDGSPDLCRAVSFGARARRK